MLRYTTGDIFAADAEALVNTVNCVGVMGRGLALQFKRMFPRNFEEYAAACQRNEVVPGSIHVHETGNLTNPQYILNFPTKRHWRGKSRIEDIESGLNALRETVVELGIGSVALPPLGTGLGGLDWSEVRSRMEVALAGIGEVDFLIYEPGGGPRDTRANRSSKVPEMTSGRAALIGLMDRYLAGLMDTNVTLLEVHKLLYFLQEAGEPLKLRYQRGAYGPYAENLRHVLNAIEGHFVSGYLDGGDQPDKVLAVVPGARAEAAAFLKQANGTTRRFQQVSGLVEGFETPFGMELLGTVHMVLKEQPDLTREGLVDAVHAWSERKRRFLPEQIAIARRQLHENEFIPPP